MFVFGDNRYGQLGIGDSRDLYTPRMIDTSTIFTSRDERYFMELQQGGLGAVALHEDIKTILQEHADADSNADSSCNGGITAVDMEAALNGNDVIQGTIKVVEVACGEYFTVVRTSCGRAATCGLNWRGQIGHGKTARSSNFLQWVRFSSQNRSHGETQHSMEVLSVCCGRDFSAFLLKRNAACKIHDNFIEDVEVWTCGSGDYGQTWQGHVRDIYQPTYASCLHDDVHQFINGRPDRRAWRQAQEQESENKPKQMVTSQTEKRHNIRVFDIAVRPNALLVRLTSGDVLMRGIGELFQHNRRREQLNLGRFCSIQDIC